MKLARYAAIFVIGIVCVTPFFSTAQSVDDLQKQIDANNAQLAQLNAEIAQYTAQLNTTTTQKNTLQNKINQLDLQRKKLQATVTATQTQISTTQAQIATLGQTITKKQATVEDDKAALEESIRSLARTDSQSLAVSMLSSDTLTDAWEDTDALAQLQDAVHSSIQSLNAETQSLAASKTAAEQKKTQLLTQQKTLTTQQGSLTATRQSQAELLAQTKSQEASYQKIIAEKKAQEASFESTINALQAKLKSANTSTIPIAGAVFSWPLDNVYITQYFGMTEFAKTAAYSGNGHNGIDLRATIGTPVRAAGDGTVWDTNLGVAPNCQYGKWVLVKHDNGLSTLYAHLSSIKVSAGQRVSTGDVLGYSGETGYATGPHLHFTVYNTSGVSFITYKCASGPSVRVPVSPFNGYLNPMLYLPAI